MGCPTLQISLEQGENNLVRLAQLNLSFNDNVVQELYKEPGQGNGERSNEITREIKQSNTTELGQWFAIIHVGDVLYCYAPKITWIPPMLLLTGINLYSLCCFCSMNCSMKIFVPLNIEL